MRVIICGAGQVGYGIAERLAAEDNDISVIDTSAELIQVIRPRRTCCSTREMVTLRGLIWASMPRDLLRSR